MAGHENGGEPLEDRANWRWSAPGIWAEFMPGCWPASKASSWSASPIRCPKPRRRSRRKTRSAETADFRDLIPRIDAAIVATPTRFHHAVAMELLEHGIHLLVEKPITSTVAEAEELVWRPAGKRPCCKSATSSDSIPALTPLLARLARPRYIEAVRQGPYSFRSTDISVVLDLMIHDLDLALWLTGGIGARCRRPSVGR